MSGSTKTKAIIAATRVIPMQDDEEAYRQRISDFVKGYMAGHAAHTRWANKKVFEYRAAISAGADNADR